MDINQLNCFITVAQTLNFSEAARRNYVSQSTVSRYVSDLEKEFGVQLFTRSHRDVIITSEGKALLPYAIEIVETLKKAKTVIKQMHDGGQGKITLGCDVTSLSFPTKCIADFAEKYPGITIDVRQLDEADRTLAITGGEYDFCFMPRDMVPESSGIESIITHNETLSVVTAKNSKFSGRKSVKLSELADESILVLSESVAPMYIWKLWTCSAHFTSLLKSVIHLTILFPYMCHRHRESACLSYQPRLPHTLLTNTPIHTLLMMRTQA